MSSNDAYFWHVRFTRFARAECIGMDALRPSLHGLCNSTPVTVSRKSSPPPPFRRKPPLLSVQTPEREMPVEDSGATDGAGCPSSPSLPAAPASTGTSADTISADTKPSLTILLRYRHASLSGPGSRSGSASLLILLNSRLSPGCGISFLSVLFRPENPISCGGSPCYHLRFGGCA